jgi:hypothetical protein
VFIDEKAKQFFRCISRNIQITRRDGSLDNLFVATVVGKFARSENRRKQSHREMSLSNAAFKIARNE